MKQILYKLGLVSLGLDVILALTIFSNSYTGHLLFHGKKYADQFEIFKHAISKCEDKECMDEAMDLAPEV